VDLLAARFREFDLRLERAQGQAQGHSQQRMDDLELVRMG
jgi:hypothetical protein